MLSLLFSELQVEYSNRDVKNRLTNLRISMFTGTAKPWSKYAFMDCKRGEAKHMLSPLLAIIRKLFEGTTKTEEAKKISAGPSLEKLVQLWDDSGTFLKPTEYEKTLSLGKGF